MNIHYSIRHDLDNIIIRYDGSISTPKTFGVSWFGSIFANANFNNEYIIKSIVQSRKREKELAILLQRDETAIKILFQDDWTIINHKRDGLITTDNEGQITYRDFPLYDYNDRYIFFDKTDILDKIVHYNEFEDKWFILNDYSQHLVQLLHERVPNFPLCIDISIVDVIFSLDKLLTVKMKCLQKICLVNLSWFCQLTDLCPTTDDGFIITALIFGEHYCRHIDGRPPKNVITGKLNVLPIYQIGRTFSSIKTHAMWIDSIEPSSLISCTSKQIINYGQIKYKLKKFKGQTKFKDVIDNILLIEENTTNNELKYLKIPHSQPAINYFGFVHAFTITSPLSLSLYSRPISYILFYYSKNLYFDTTGGIINGKLTWFNFFMSINSPWGGIQPYPLMENIATSKTCAQMYSSLTQFGNGYNLFYGNNVGPIKIQEKKYAHMDTDKATSNAVCIWGNGVPLNKYTADVWNNWDSRILSSFLIVIVWCWCHICGYIARYTKPFEKYNKPAQHALKSVGLWYIKLIKLCLILSTLLIVVNELYIILNLEELTIGEATILQEITFDSIIAELSKNELSKNAKGFFKKQSIHKAEASACAEANKLLVNVQKSIIQDPINIINDNDNNIYYSVHNKVHYWSPIKKYKNEIKLCWRENSDYLFGTIGRLPIPIVRKNNKIRLTTFCPDYWSYLFKTVIYAPLYNDMETGGSKIANNMPAESINRFIKFIEGIKRVALDTYVNYRSSSTYRYCAQFLMRLRESISNHFVKMPFMKDCWNGKGTKAAAASAFDISVINHFKTLCQFEHSLCLSFGKDKLKNNLLSLISKTEYKDEYNFMIPGVLSKSIMHSFKNNKELPTKTTKKRKALIYLVLFIRKHLLIYNFNCDDKDHLKIDNIPEYDGFHIDDYKTQNDEQ